MTLDHNKAEVCSCTREDAIEQVVLLAVAFFTRRGNIRYLADGLDMMQHLLEQLGVTQQEYGAIVFNVVKQAVNDPDNPARN